MVEEAIPDTNPTKETVTVTSWERINNNVAIWGRTPKEVTDAEYESFYQAISKVCGHTHVQAMHGTTKAFMMNFCLSFFTHS